MSPASAPPQTQKTRNIEYLSRPAAVSMADRWFEIASIDHFWIRRRFAVLKALAGGLIGSAREMAEIGCGHGLLQRQVEDQFAKTVTGFDLNEYALQQNLSRSSRVCCYDIFERDTNLRQRFDLIFLFDVLEHLADEDKFLDAVRYHLTPGGKLVINVPAGPWAFSAYDTAAGHVRRYSSASLEKAAAKNHLPLERWTYWGLPLVPTLAIRKLWLSGKTDASQIISTGFDSRNSLINAALGALARCEPLPQKLLGTSLMAVFESSVGTR